MCIWRPQLMHVPAAGYRTRQAVHSRQVQSRIRLTPQA